MNIKIYIFFASWHYFFLSSLRIDSSADVAMRSLDSSMVSRADGSVGSWFAVYSLLVFSFSAPHSHSMVTEKARERR